MSNSLKDAWPSKDSEKQFEEELKALIKRRDELLVELEQLNERILARQELSRLSR
jgi:hypothetical protein